MGKPESGNFGVDVTRLFDVKQVSQSEEYSWSWHGWIVELMEFPWYNYLPPYVNSINCCLIKILVGR